MDLSFSVSAILFATGFMAGGIDAIAGGGGMISLPMLLSMGVPPHLALGTNKLQGTIGTFIATRQYYRADLLPLNNVFKKTIFCALGAIAGALLAQVASNDLLKEMIPLMLILIFFYMLFSPKLGHDDHPPRVAEFYFYGIAGFLLGLYDGFLGPGTGSFWVFALIYFLGFNIRKAMAHTKLMNLSSNVIATLCFQSIGHHDFCDGELSNVLGDHRFGILIQR